MRPDRALWFTIYRIILGDMLLNWLLGLVLLIFPSGLDRLIGTAPVLPLLLYRLTGIGFLLFAAWQTWIVRRGEIGPLGLTFAALMALGPVVLLTAALLFLDLPLEPLWRIVLWVANGYMVLLAVWYLTLARSVARAGSQPGPA